MTVSTSSAFAADPPLWEPKNFLEEAALMIEKERRVEEEKSRRDLFDQIVIMAAEYDSLTSNIKYHYDYDGYNTEVKGDGTTFIESNSNSRSNQKRPILSKRLENRLAYKASRRLHNR